MGLDIQHILDDWLYEQGQVTVRRIRGADGRDKVQLRLDLGLLQMETEGRPDGQRPHGFDSLLDYYEHQLDEHRGAHGTDAGFELDERACELLRAEGLMYYYRYLAMFVLEEYGAVERDTKRNLSLFDFCSTYATEESDRYVMEQYRPYVLMMISRSRAHIALGDNRPKAAMAAVQEGIDAIRDFYRRFGQENLFDASGEVAILNGLTKEIEPRIPADPLQKLNTELTRAVAEERYEEAAHLRDLIHRAASGERTGESSPP